MRQLNSDKRLFYVLFLITLGTMVGNLKNKFQIIYKPKIPTKKRNLPKLKISSTKWINLGRNFL